MIVMVLGASGMLGSALYRHLGRSKDIKIIGTLRDKVFAKQLGESRNKQLWIEPNITEAAHLDDILARARPDMVINSIGVVKQLSSAQDPLVTLPVNAVFPHQLQHCCQNRNIRLIHISTDCVFSGSKGNYSETDTPDPVDLYGHSKLLGEVTGPNTITFRTSFIGHEMGGGHSLLEWFLAQKQATNGFTKVFFSGLPTVELAHIIENFVLPDTKLHGLYHLSAEPISKYELLNLVGNIYEKEVKLHPMDSPQIDRSLDSARFKTATGYVPPSWPDLIKKMRAAQLDVTAP